MISLGYAAVWALIVVQAQAQAHVAAATEELSSVNALARDSVGTLLVFDDWMDVHEKTYASSKERQLREGIFLANTQVVMRHNLAYEGGHTSYVMTTNSPFADLTADEFATTYLMDGQNCSATHTSSGSLRERLQRHAGLGDEDTDHDVSLPTFVDWRTRGIVTPVKNQQKCGSCWAFSTTGTLEAHTCLYQGQGKESTVASKDCTKWTGLAEQQLLDCASAYDNHGCNGGLPSHAFEYIKDAGGLDTEDSYAYRANDDGTCAASCCSVGARVAEVYNITAYDEEDLVSAIAQVGPVSIAYQVSPDFRLYSHGVYDSYNSTTNKTMCQNGPQNVNHAVVAVGYGATEGTDKSPPVPFYIIRNSWSTSWGMEGYFWMKRNENLCGVSDCASFPIVPSSPLASMGTPRTNAVGFNDKTDVSTPE